MKWLAVLLACGGFWCFAQARPGPDSNYNISISGGGAPTTTWDPANIAPDITLSGGSLIATNAANNSTAYSGTRGIANHSTGQFYFEVTMGPNVNASEDVMVGFQNATHGFTSTFIGKDNDSMGYDSGGVVWRNSVVLFTFQTYTATNVVAFALDLTNSKIWVRTSANTNWNNDVIANQNPATNTGGVSIVGINAGPYYPGLTLQEFATTRQGTANFGGSSYALAVPSGFGNW